ncbi:Nuclear aminoacylation-dependent tRNA export pathway component [Cryptotrichosporon argae]
MNYLKSITSSVLQSTGVTFPFSIGERIPGLDTQSSIWEIREGVKRDDGTPLTLFIFDSTLPPFQPGNKDRRTLLQLARNALKKMRTIRHPDVIKYIDSVETETHVYIATEQVRPLEGVLRDWEPGGALAGAKNKEAKEAWLGWGVKSISTALAFLNAAPLSLHHAYAIPSSIFVTPALEWRLGGFELLTGKDDSAGVLWALGGVAPGGAGDWSAPEVKKGGWGVLREANPAQSDVYILALLIYHLYNPTQPLPQFTTAPTPSSAGALPKSLFPQWKAMLIPNARTRLATATFAADLPACAFLANNPLVSLVDGLDNFELKSEGEKQALLRIIRDSTEKGSLPGPFVTHRVLPSLLHSLSLPDAPSSAMLPLVLNLGRHVPAASYGKLVLEPVIKLYASPDRGTRMALLDGLGEYVDKLDAKMVTERIWPHLITGFADTVPVIREATVKSVYPLANKLSDRILNNDLLRLLAKMQVDTEPSIRTNTCILLGRLAPILGTNTKKKVLVPAFARSLKDPFVHARVAGLMALMATVECFDRDDLAGKVIPNMAFALVDKEKLVRDQAFKAMALFMKRIEGMVASMPDTVLEDRSYGPVTTTSATAPQNQAGLVNSATGAAGALAGWAISSLSKQLATTEIHSSMTATSSLTVPGATPDASPSASPRPSSDSSIFGSSAPAAPARPAAAVSPFGTGAAPSSSRGGMKLGGGPKKAVPSPLADVLGDDDDAAEVANAWGDDLMDVHADADDWTAFESAPVPEIVVPPPQSYYVSPPKPAPPPARPPSAPAAAPSKPAAPTLSKPAASPALKPAAAPAFDDWGNADDDEHEGGPSEPSKPGTPVPSLASLSKDDKEKEMARRREERKARIAAMKEQKKAKA